MDVAMDIEVEHQITQPEQQLTIMETCCEEPPNGGDLHNRRSLDRGPQAQKTRLTTTPRKLFTVPKESKLRAEEFPRKSKLQQIKLWIRLLQVSIQQGKWPKTMATNLCIRGQHQPVSNQSYYAAAEN